MRAKIREILDDCIADGLRSGYRRAHKYDDEPCEETMISHMEDYIWLEIDRKFDFERNVCNEVVEGFDHLGKERISDAKDRLIRIMCRFNLATGHADTMDQALDALEQELSDVLGYLRERREWVDLTNDDIQTILKEWAQNQMTVREMLREAEAKLKEKNSE